jgi:glutamyl-tRNA synthetase
LPLDDGLMTTIVRIAPSPTGLLHVGNIRTALINYLYTRKLGGQFMLRIDDTDTERSKQEYEDAIIEDLGWLGLRHEVFARQSERSADYEAAAAKLRAAGLLYPCYETADELDRRRKRQLAAHKPPIYDRAALNLTADDRGKLEEQGRQPHWRFKLSHTNVHWRDLVRGDVNIDTATLSDPVLIREDGRFLYTLPSVVDDIDFTISHVMRGEDHVVNTAVQIEITRALGAEPPAYAHTTLLLGKGGEALSKRIGSLSMRDLRAEGIEPMAVLSLLSKLGTSDAVVPRLKMDELIAEFDLGHMGRAPAQFDLDELKTLNHKLYHITPFTDVEGRLASLGVLGGEDFWLAVRDNLQTLNEAREWWSVITGPLTPEATDPAILSAAAETLPEGALDESAWGPWTQAIAAKTGAKGKALFQPLRLALTARPHGPEMKKLLPLIGRERVLKRLQGHAA